MEEIKRTPGMRLEGHMQAHEHALQICGPETGHVLRAVAYFDDAWRAAEVGRALNSHAALLEALTELLTYDRVERPAFRAKPLGAPNSPTRIAQDKLIEVEDKARAAIHSATSAGGE